MNFSIMTGSRPLPSEQDDQALQKSVAEEPGEQERREKVLG